MGGCPELPFGLATSVGPLPCADPAEAVRMALRAQPEFPTIPVLAGSGTSLLAQAVAGLRGVQVVPPGLLRVDDEFDPSEVPDADPVGSESAVLEEFFAADRGPGTGVRVAVLGPVTLALALRAGGVPTETAVDLAAELAAARAARLLGVLRAGLAAGSGTGPGGGPVLVCASEPGLIGAVHPTFPLSPGQVLNLLVPFVDALDRHPLAGELMIGVHVPGRTDWQTVIASGVSVISLPADRSLVRWAEALGGFLERGGRIVWGAVPVDQPLGTGEELLWRRLSAVWCDLVGEGMDPLALRSRSLVGPVDGLGHFGLSQAERALDLVDSLSTRVRRQAVGARLTLGA